MISKQFLSSQLLALAIAPLAATACSAEQIVPQAEEQISSPTPPANGARNVLKRQAERAKVERRGQIRSADDKPSPSEQGDPVPAPEGSHPQQFPPIPELDRQQLLTAMLFAHNEARQALGQSALVIDESLSRQARDHAIEMALSKRFEHSDASTRPEQGENLWVGKAGQYPPALQAAAWINQRQHYAHGQFPDVSRTGNAQDVSNYTQIVWGETKRIGCGSATVDGLDYVVCRYAPAGNVLGQYPF